MRTAAPRWRKEPNGTVLTLDGRVNVDCQADGFPEPKITWSRIDAKGKEISKLVGLKLVLIISHYNQEKNNCSTLGMRSR